MSSQASQETKLAQIGHVTHHDLGRACHMPRQSLQNHLSGHLGKWTTPWSAEEILDGQRQRVDVAAHDGTARDDLIAN